MTAARKKAPPLTIVTGLAGAGMTSVLKTLEDFGYEVFDNFPLTLVDALVKDSKRKRPPIAIGIDARARGFSAAALIAAAQRQKARLVFITCDDNILQRRFTETRRRHPLALGKSVKSGIKKERQILKPVLAKADLAIDTSNLSVHDLRHILEGHFSVSGKSRLSVSLMSFAFKYGTPREADIIMDIRFLKNPHWQPKLRGNTGKDKAVQEYIRRDAGWTLFMQRFTALIRDVLPLYEKEGKNYLTIAIGCTGGRHRSVFAVEELRKWLKGVGYAAHTEHRDLEM